MSEAAVQRRFHYRLRRELQRPPRHRLRPGRARSSDSDDHSIAVDDRHPDERSGRRNELGRRGDREEGSRQATMMLNETLSFGVSECPIVRPEGIYYGGRKVISLGLSGPDVTWVGWYNAASAYDQTKVDEDVAALEEGSSTPEQKQNYIDVFGGSAGEKDALRNYLATGGRAALFAKPAKNYGPQPIAVVKPQGPIEAVPNTSGGVTLHHGTYTYSNVTATGAGFDEWVRNNANTVSNTVVQSSASVLPGGPSYYSDNLFVVYQDTFWPASLSGLPTWLPPGTDPVKYWGKVTPPAPPAPFPPFPDSDTFKWALVAGAIAVAVVGGALIIYYVP